MITYIETDNIFNGCVINYFKIKKDDFPSAFMSYSKQYEHKIKKTVPETNTLFIVSDTIDSNIIESVFNNMKGFLEFNIINHDTKQLCFITFDTVANASNALVKVKANNMINYNITFSKSCTRNLKNPIKKYYTPTGIKSN